MRTAHAFLVRLLSLAIALFVCPRESAAQVIRGAVNAEGTGAPLRGAVITLLDANGHAAGLRVLTDNDGSFAMRAPSPGSWVLEARAIGYAPRKTNARTVAAGETVVERIVLRQVATRLATLRVEARSACRKADELDAVTTEVWDDI